MNEIDFLLEAAQRDLDLLKMKYKTQGAKKCTQEMEDYDDTNTKLFHKLHKQIES